MNKYEINYSKMTADTVNIEYDHNSLKVEVKPEESDKLSTLNTNVLNKTESVSVKTVKTNTEVTVKKDKPKKVAIPDIYDDVYDNAVNAVVAVPDSNPVPVTDNEVGFSSWMFLVPLIVVVLFYIIFGKKEEPIYYNDDSYDNTVYKGPLGEREVSNAIRKSFT